MIRAHSMVDHFRSSLVAAGTNGLHRNSIASMRSAKGMVSSSVTEVDKPVASGGGLSCSILLAEPNLFLTGFDHDGLSRRQHESYNSAALLRGKLQLTVTKNVKIKAITLKLTGKARTEWPEGIPPLKVDMYEEETLRTQTLVFFHAMHERTRETEYGNPCNFWLKGMNNSTLNLKMSLSPNQPVASLHRGNRSRQSSNLSEKERKRLSLQSVNSRSFGKGDNPVANPVQAKGYKVFYPGIYDYSFEFLIDHNQLETTKMQYGTVKWELESNVERAGAFKPNLHGTKEALIVRVPDQLSLEMTEPISISRQWEDQLHYDIMISGKSFPIGAKIPIAFKLTPLAKVHVHKLKVFVTESIEYWTNDRRVARRDPGRKILLLEKTAGKPLEKQFGASEIRALSGGELSPVEREEARRSAASRRALEAARTNEVPEPLPELTDNLLGDLDLGLETYWGSTEIEMNVQLPTCDRMEKDKTLKLHPDCSWKNVNVFHWIKIVMRISRPDPEDSTGKRRRHFEISIDSPFNVLNCRATQTHTLLPRYCGHDGPATGHWQQMACGCPDAQVVVGDSSPSSSTATLAMVEETQQNINPNSSNIGADGVDTFPLPLPPRAVRLQSPVIHGAMAWPAPPQPGSSASLMEPVWNQEGPGNPYLGSPLIRHRPMELIRYPSYNPPAFDADSPPPLLPLETMTPPPNYDVIIGTPSVDGLADYFARLADYEDPEHEHDVHPAAQGYANGLGITDAGVRLSGESTHAGMAAAGVDYLAGGGQSEVPTTGEGEEEEESDSGDDHPARIHHGGRVNVANPRTPGGGRLVPSRSLDLERPIIRLNMAGVVR